MNTLGIKGEPESGIIAKTPHGEYLMWDSNAPVITAHDEDGIYDRMDCCFYDTWEEVKRNVLSELGWIIK